MSQVGVLKLRGRFTTILATLILMAGVSLLVGSAAQAHAPDGWVHTDLIEGNTNQEDAGDAYLMVDGDTVSVHWHLTGDFAEATVTNQFICAGSYPISPANERCKPGQAPDGTVFSPTPIGNDDWSFTYAGDKSAFQLHISVRSEAGSTLLGNWEDQGETDDDGQVDDGTSDDGQVDDGTSDDGQVDDGTADDGSDDDSQVDDGTADDGSDDDGQVDDGTSDDGQVDDGTSDDGQVDDGTSDDGTSDDGTEVQDNTVVKPKPQVGGKVLAQTGPETTMLTIIGSLFLLLGIAMRFGRFGTPAAAASTGHDVLVARTLALVERTVSRNGNWNCRF